MQLEFRSVVHFPTAPLSTLPNPDSNLASLQKDLKLAVDDDTTFTDEKRAEKLIMDMEQFFKRLYIRKINLLRLEKRPLDHKTCQLALMICKHFSGVFAIENPTEQGFTEDPTSTVPDISEMLELKVSQSSLDALYRYSKILETSNLTSNQLS